MLAPDCLPQELETKLYNFDHSGLAVLSFGLAEITVGAFWYCRKRGPQVNPKRKLVVG